MCVRSSCGMCPDYLSSSSSSLVSSSSRSSFHLPLHPRRHGGSADCGAVGQPGPARCSRGWEGRNRPGINRNLVTGIPARKSSPLSRPLAPMLRRSLFACLAATAAALTAPRPTLGPTALGRAQRSRPLFAHLLHGWAIKIDDASGDIYYYNENTGETQWEPPQAVTAQQIWGTQVLWVVAPAVGMLHEYTVCNGHEQVLGRYDMITQNPYISRAQCLMRVEDGTASLVSLGKAPTALRAPGGKWTNLRKGQAHILADGEEIALDSKNPDAGYFPAIFTVYSLQDNLAQLGGYEQQDGYGPQDGYGLQDVYRPPDGYGPQDAYGQPGGYY
jgi:hypothetical protein